MARFHNLSNNALAALLPGGGCMITYTDVSDLVRNAAEMRYLATTDFMTNQFNRRHFLALAEAERESAFNATVGPSRFY
jgi:hypothetical protein